MTAYDGQLSTFFLCSAKLRTGVMAGKKPLSSSRRMR